MLALEALAVVAAWHGFNWLNQPPSRPETWLEAGKPLTDILPPNPTGTTTIDVEAEETVDVCLADAILTPGRGVAQPLFCSKNRKDHSISIHRRPVPTAFAIETPRRAGRVRLKLLITQDTSKVSPQGLRSQGPSIMNTER